MIVSLSAWLCATGTGPRPGVGIASADEGEHITIQGTGATFPAPLYQRWFSEYNKLHPDVQINYQALGSGAGVKQFQEGLVNFGASDAAMTDEEIAAVKDGVVLLPMTAGSIVLAYNLPGGPTELKLSREAYAGIFLGKITQWNDPVIAKANPGREASRHQDHRRHPLGRQRHDLRLHQPPERDQRGLEEAGPAPARRSTCRWASAAKGNAGRDRAASSRRPARSATSSTATPSRPACRWPTLENKSGKFVKADLETGKKALGGVELPAEPARVDPRSRRRRRVPDRHLHVAALSTRSTTTRRSPKALKSVIEFGLTEGQKFSDELGYIPLPAKVVTDGAESARRDLVIGLKLRCYRRFMHRDRPRRDRRARRMDISQPPSASTSRIDRALPHATRSRSPG